MKDVIFSDMFRFYEIERSKYHYSDNRSGSQEHYIAYMLQGHCRIVANGHMISAKEGDLFYIPMGLPYQSYWYGDSSNSIRFLSLGFRWFPENDSSSYLLQVLPKRDEWCEKVQQIPTNTALGSTAVGRFFALLSELLPLMEKNDFDSKRYLLQQAKTYMYEHTDCTVRHVARHCGVSESTLYTVFKESLGKTPHAVKQELLCEKAVFLLSTTDKSVQEISDMLGFSSPSYFRKILKVHTANTPREIRRRFLTV